jgi:hypothetical protein
MLLSPKLILTLNLHLPSMHEALGSQEQQQQQKA